MTPKSSALAATGNAPAHLADAARTRNNRTNLRIGDDRLLELRILIIAQILMHEAREQLGLDKAEHATLYGSAVVRQCRTMGVRPNKIKLTGPPPPAFAKKKARTGGSP